MRYYKYMLSPKVLIVDDDKDIVDAIEAILQMENYHVTHAYRGSEGIRAAEAEAPRLILLDYMLPDMNGEEVALMIKTKAALKNTHVILISASKNIEEIARRSPIDGYLEKPFEMDHLLDVVKRYAQ